MTTAPLRWARFARLTGTLVAVAATSSCANLYLHNDTRQQQVEATNKAWADIEHETLFSIERENLTKLAQAEQQTQVRVAAAMREYLAAVIAAPARDPEDALAREKRSVGSLVLKRAQSKFAALVGPLDTYDKRIAAADKSTPIENSIAGLTERLQRVGSPVLD